MIQKAEKSIIYNNANILEQSRTEYGYSLYVLGLILMLVVALVAQTIGSFPLTGHTESQPTSTQRELQNSPEIGN